MNTKQTIADEIASIEVLTVGGDPANIPLKLRLLKNLYFNRRHQQGDMLKIMTAIEKLVTVLDERAMDEDEVGFEILWENVESQYSSIKSVAKRAMRLGYRIGRDSITR